MKIPAQTGEERGDKFIHYPGRDPAAFLTMFLYDFIVFNHLLLDPFDWKISFPSVGSRNALQFSRCFCIS